jgi:hypothetical protein
MSRIASCVAVMMLLSVASFVEVTAQRGTGFGAGRANPNAPNAIVGRVTDVTGRPVAEVLVTALASRTWRGTTRLAPVDVRLGSRTNERGEFRLDGLSFGEFYLVAFPRRVAAGNRATRSGNAITYYPSAREAKDAKPIVVSVKAPATAEIVLAPAKLFDISGIVTGSDGQPVRGGTFGLTHGDGLFGLDSIGVVIRPDGTFLAPGLPPGTYHLHFREGLWPPPRDVIPKVSGAKVTVTDSDVTNVRLTPIAMVRGTGRVVVDSADRSDVPFSTIQIGATPTNSDGNPGPSRPGFAKQDLTFEFRTWPAVSYVRVFIESPGWVVKAIRLNGADVTDKDLDFRDDVSGLEIEVVRRPGR